MSHSQDYHDRQQHPSQQQQQANVNNIFAFPNGFDRCTEDQPTTTVVEVDHTGGGLNPAYESAGIFSEMFNFGPGPGSNNPRPGPELLDYRRATYSEISGHHEWYGDQHQHGDNQIGGGAINAHNSDAAMQLFLTNAPPRSPSPPPPPPEPSFHHMGVVTASNNDSFWGTAPHHHNVNNPVELTGMIGGQGLSLSLSSSLQQFEAAKQAEDNQIIFFNQHQGPSSSATNAPSPNTVHFFKNLTTPGPQAHNPAILHNLQPVGGFMGPSTSSIGFGSSASTSASLGVVNVLSNSKYAKPAQELLEEFCSVGRGHQLKKPKLGRQNSSNNPNPASGTGGGGASGGAGSLSTKEPSQLSPADRVEHQRRKVKLLAMLDEVDRIYNHYYEQMQTVVNSFDLVMGIGGAIPYTALAQKAMSRHFRCLKDAIHAQIKHSCELLGEKDPTASSGLTKGETPRLKMLEQSLRQQRAFHQMGMMDQEAWRPQRGLPERSVNILRAWLFEHFLHPYPSDVDKHLLARQTGLSRNQVSNWFINARVRLWKPMVEEMYQQEAKDREEKNNNNEDQEDDEIRSQQQQHPPVIIAQNPMTSSSSSASTTMLSEPQGPADTIHPTPPDCDPSLLAINRHADVYGLPSTAFIQGGDGDGDGDGDDEGAGHTTMIRFGGASGDVSLTLGLRHSGDAPETSGSFSVRDFGGC